jgi:hypothetical protein
MHNVGVTAGQPVYPTEFAVPLFPTSSPEAPHLCRHHPHDSLVNKSFTKATK